MKPTKRILFIGNSLSDMIKCRGHVISRINQEGHSVYLIAPEDKKIVLVQNLSSIKWYNWFLRPNNHNPFVELVSFCHLIYLFFVIRPNLVFSYTVKPNIYVSLLRKLFKFKNCCVVTGLGRIFTIKNPFYMLMKRIVFYSFKSATQVWVMNSYDFQFLKEAKVNTTICYMPGEGVDTEKFSPLVKPSNDFEQTTSVIPKFVFIGRLLKSKGLEELMDAIKELSQKNIKISLIVVGPYDKNDPDKIDKRHFDELVSQGLINYVGYLEDVRELIHESDCLILPSYREGLPRVILEASAMERPIITTDVPGCQDLVIPNITGFLIRARSSKSIKEALEKFIELSVEERHRLGVEGRKLISRRFTNFNVQNFYLSELNNLI